MSHEFEALYYIYDAGYRWGPPDAVYHLGGNIRRLRPTTPPLVTREEVASRIHDDIVADAATTILHKAHLSGTYEIDVTLADFNSPTGFLRLLNYGAGYPFSCGYMLAPSKRNPEAFEPTASFWDRLIGMPEQKP